MFSSPEILELKAQFELARYRGAAPVVCNVRSDSLDTNDLLKFYELYFYPSPFLLQSS
jgi:hypothetical protein